ncbi:hypothetical protein DTL21_25335 [Bremerella cremea]|uniref:MobA-like NTP transferase domain-containing protein n=1 Tax=Blastopirellula marina TaxID=124 RepID=A0A2S8FB62_9BACT|nr:MULTISPECIES: NTP transferase domain-containing protein [Pirellulaceae]PQO29391.1 hypothetical protein C5Y83_25290 [Blastopirellula marina]RCS42695.1 hypothetical protein DTL21_25335 [Bremerella cremea]
MKHLAIVQIDDQLNLAPGEQRSDALAPSKLAGRKLAAKPLIEWLVRRVSEAELIDGIVVVMPDEPQYRELANLIPLDIPCHFSTKSTPLARLADASAEYPSSSVVRVPLETPFCDPVLIDRLLTTAQQHEKKDYIGYSMEDGSPACRSNIGLFAEWIRSSALAKAAREVKSVADSYHINSSFLDYPELFKQETLPVPKSLDRNDLRFSVGNEDDWEELLAIVDVLGTETLEWQDMVRVIDGQPTMRDRMAQRNRVIA